MGVKKECNLSAADIVCAKEFITGYGKTGKPMIKAGKEKFFNGFGIVLNPVDKEVTDPTCAVMLPCGKIIRVKEERLIAVVKNDTDTC